MTIEITKDLEAGVLTVTEEYRAPVEAVWQLWADPRKFERWWGPPMFPATVTEHGLHAGGEVKYHLTGPEGEEHHGYWRVLAVEPPHVLEIEDSFADENGVPNPEMPSSTMRVELTDLGDGRTRMQVVSNYPDVAQLEQVISMGIEEGLKGAMSQIDAILAEILG